MQKKHRRWFDDAYEISNGFLPFAYFVHQAPQDAIRFFLGREDARFERFIAKVSRHFSRRRPPAEAFAEEKSRVLRLLVPELEKLFGYSDAGIEFGSVVGDIDIAVVDIGEVSNATYKKQLRSLAKKYPIVDWPGMLYFRSRSGEQVFQKILQSRRECCQHYGLDLRKRRVYDCERRYIRATAEHAFLLWGNPAELDALVADARKL